MQLCSSCWRPASREHVYGAAHVGMVYCIECVVVGFQHPASTSLQAISVIACSLCCGVLQWQHILLTLAERGRLTAL
jgi:hypothetical protein